MKAVLVQIIWLAISSSMMAQIPDSTKEVRSAEVMVESNRSFSAASNSEYRMRDLQTMPRNSTQDLLRVVPGLTTSQHAGGGKAEQIFLRGFDCDHGTDININVDGAPVNMVSHGHGQGYADLHFVIPETVERIEVVKGPYLAAYGDLTTAGAVTFTTADTITQNNLKAEAGAFDTYRVLGLVNTAIGSIKMYAGLEATRTQGFFTIPQEFSRYNAIAKLYSPLTENSELVGSITGFTSSWNASGQIPDRAVSQGLISSFGSIDPNEGGNTSRLTAQLAYRYNGSSPLEFQTSITDYRFRLFSNFTFYSINPERGDMIEQTDNRKVYTTKLTKTFCTIHEILGLKTVIGGNARYDDINAALYSNSARHRVETIQSANISWISMFTSAISL
jgi:outer membrane receptor protein involved in Fe transport